jgi:hypothetical protein
MSDILDRNIVDPDDAYDVFVYHADEVAAEAAARYTQSRGHAPALADLHHGYWRAIVERTRWRTLRAAFADAWPIQGEPPTPPIPPALGPLRIEGTAFYDSVGIWKWHGASHFRMFRQWLDGVDQVPVYAWARGLGVNTFRVFTMLSWAGLRPTDYLDEQLRVFAEEVGAQGFRLELVALADCVSLMPSAEDQRRHVARIGEIVGGMPHVFVELANEPSHPTNEIDPLAFLQVATPCLWSRGSSHGDQPAIIPPWDYGTDHTPRDGEWPRKAKNLLEWAAITQVPYLGDEPKKIRGGELSPSDCADYAAVADLLASGSTIHTQSLGIDGRVPDGAEQACCEAYAASWRAVPPDAQLGRYTAGHLGDCPIEYDPSTALRIFGTMQGRRADVVLVRPTADWRLVVRPPWRVVAQRGPVLRLEQ